MLRALFLSWMDFLMSPFHHGTLGLCNLPGERPIEMLAVSNMRDVKSLTTVLIFVFVGIWRLEVLFSISE